MLTCQTHDSRGGGVASHPPTRSNPWRGSRSSRAGVNLCGRPPGADWSKDTYLPDGGELAEHFAERYGYPGPDRHDLGRVSQFIDLQLREMALYTDLREIFTGAYGPTELHRFLAELPRAMRERGQPVPFQLIVTTNYDDALERAFGEAGQEFDLVLRGGDRD